jgi:hypothetical protein
MGRRVRCTWEANYFRYYKRLGAIEKLATSYHETMASRARDHGLLEGTLALLAALFM